MREKLIDLGEFSIAEYDSESVWIERSDGEGGAFQKSLLDEAIAEFYKKHF